MTPWFRSSLVCALVGVADTLLDAASWLLRRAQRIGGIPSPERGVTVPARVLCRFRDERDELRLAARNPANAPRKQYMEGVADALDWAVEAMEGRQ